MNPFANGVSVYNLIKSANINYISPLAGLAAGALSYKNPTAGIPVSIGALSGMVASDLLSRDDKDKKNRPFLSDPARGFASGIFPGALLAHILKED